MTKWAFWCIRKIRDSAVTFKNNSVECECPPDMMSETDDTGSTDVDPYWTDTDCGRLGGEQKHNNQGMLFFALKRAKF
jgi:hypothetical protein